MYGDSSMAQKELGWAPKTSFEDMIKIMVNADLNRLQP
jgi:GDPmannose 4,6-dehydratase